MFDAPVTAINRARYLTGYLKDDKAVVAHIKRDLGVIISEKEVAAMRRKPVVRREAKGSSVDLVSDTKAAREGSKALLSALAAYHLKRAKTEEEYNHWRALTSVRQKGFRGPDKKPRKVRQPNDAVLDIFNRALVLEGVDVAEFNAKGNGRRFVAMRQAIALAAYKEAPQLGYAGIARLLERNDRSTIVHYIERGQERYERDPDFAQLVEALRG